MVQVKWTATSEGIFLGLSDESDSEKLISTVGLLPFVRFEPDIDGQLPRQPGNGFR